MQLTIDIPTAAEEPFRQAFGPDLSEAVKEALLIKGYQTGRISLGLVAEILELPTSLAARRWLAERNVPLNYGLDDLEADRETHRKLLNIPV